MSHDSWYEGCSVATISTPSWNVRFNGKFAAVNLPRYNSRWKQLCVSFPLFARRTDRSGVNLCRESPTAECWRLIKNFALNRRATPTMETPPVSLLPFVGGLGVEKLLVLSFMDARTPFDSSVTISNTERWPD